MKRALLPLALLYALAILLTAMACWVERSARPAWLFLLGSGLGALTGYLLKRRLERQYRDILKGR